MERILIIESDWYFSAKLCYEIDAAGYLPTAAFSLEKAKQLMQADWFSLILSELQVWNFSAGQENQKPVPAVPDFF